jgi:hypothetical protein
MHQSRSWSFSCFYWGAGQRTAFAAPATATGPAALALAAVVAEQAPLAGYEKRVIARLFSGNTNLRFFPKDKISVGAVSVVCRVSNEDITARTCEHQQAHRARAPGQ